MAAYGGIDIDGVMALADHYAALRAEDGDYADARSCLEQAMRTFELEVRQAVAKRCADLCAKTCHVSSELYNQAALDCEAAISRDFGIDGARQAEG